MRSRRLMRSPRRPRRLNRYKRTADNPCKIPRPALLAGASANHHRGSQVRSRLAAGWIRTFGPPSEGQRFRGSPFERMQKAANAQKRDGESDAVAFSRWITHTAAGKTAYAEDRHAALTDACKVYRFPRCSVLGHR